MSFFPFDNAKLATNRDMRFKKTFLELQKCCRKQKCYCLPGEVLKNPNFSVSLHPNSND